MLLPFEELLHLDFFAAIVPHRHFAVTLADVVERFLLKVVTLFEHSGVRQLQVCVEALNDSGQETVHALAHLGAKVDHFFATGCRW